MEKKNKDTKQIVAPNSTVRSERTMTTTCTHIDVLQIQEVKYDAVPLPNDWRAQSPLDGAGEDGAEAHRHRGDADPLLLGQAELHHLCWKKRGRAREISLGKRERLSGGMKMRQVRDEGNNREGKRKKIWQEK